MVLGERGDSGFRLRWIVWTNGAAWRPPLIVKCACRMSAWRGTCELRVRGSSSSRGLAAPIFVPGPPGQGPHHEVLLPVRIAENGDGRVEQLRQDCSGCRELFERPLRWNHRERCMRPRVRFEADPRGLHLRNLGRTEERFGGGGWVPGVRLADQIRDEKDGGAESKTPEDRPRDLTDGPVAVVERENDRPAGQGRPAAPEGEPITEGDRLVSELLQRRQLRLELLRRDVEPERDGPL